ncbi:MAG: nucleoside hydrolase [Planctomycetota bacterium]
MARKVIIDADPGIGDALAIALAMLDPELDVIGATAVPGCVTGPIATHQVAPKTDRNCHRDSLIRCASTAITDSEKPKCSSRNCTTSATRRA